MRLPAERRGALWTLFCTFVLGLVGWWTWRPAEPPPPPPPPRAEEPAASPDEALDRIEAEDAAQFGPAEAARRRRTREQLLELRR